MSDDNTRNFVTSDILFEMEVLELLKKVVPAVEAYCNKTNLEAALLRQELDHVRREREKEVEESTKAGRTFHDGRKP
jgi:hypothetical protein